MAKAAKKAEDMFGPDDDQVTIVDGPPTTTVVPASGERDMVAEMAEPPQPIPGPMAMSQDTFDFAIREAVQKGAEGVAVLERLLALQTRAEEHHARKVYFDSLAKFQRRAPAVLTARQTKHYSYASFDDILHTVGPALEELGFAYRFTTRMEAPILYVTCHAFHELGHEEQTTVPMPMAKLSGGQSQVQEFGATLTYGKRYAFAAAFGITLDRDTDGPPPTPPAVEKKGHRGTAGRQEQVQQEEVVGLMKHWLSVHGDAEYWAEWVSGWGPGEEMKHAANWKRDDFEAAKAQLLRDEGVETE